MYNFRTIDRHTSRRAGKIRTGLALAGLSAIGVLAAPSSSEAAGTWQYVDANGNGRSEIAAIDRNGDGSLDEAWIDTNEDGHWDATMYDYDRNGTFEWFRAWSNTDGSQGWVFSAAYNYTFIDRDGNGQYEAHYFDGNRDGRAEYAMVDSNRDGHADTWTLLGTSTSSVNTTSTRAANDMMVQHIVTMNQLRIYGSRL